MWTVLTILVFVIISGVVFITKIRKMKKKLINLDNQPKLNVSNQPKQSIFSKFFSKRKEVEVNVEAEPIEKSPEIEVLELFPNQKDIKNIEPVKDDVLNLDDLFNTISMKAIGDDSDFDFGLRRNNKKWLFLLIENNCFFYFTCLYLVYNTG